MIGISPDTYTVSFELPGYQPQSVTGVNVFADQVADVPAQLQKSLITIGRVTARSAGSAFQPTQTSDTYSYNAPQIATALGKTFATSESNLIATLPGASFDSSGYPVIRGGRENEESFQYEGIPYTDAFTNQFVNTLALNSGAAGFQLTPGVGDASIQSAGTGTLNLISKRGTRPAFGTLDFEATTWPFNHQFGFEYGWASPDGRFSNYTALLAQNRDSVYQARNADTARIGAFFSRGFQTGRTLTDNFVFKFGNNLNQSLQIFYDNDQFNFYNNVGGYNYCYATCNNLALATIGPNTIAFTTAQIQQFTTLYPGQPTATSNLIGPNHSSQPNETFKVQYSNNIDQSTFLTAKFFKVNAGLISDNLLVGQSYVDELFVQGGQDTGVTLDITRQLNSKNLLKLGAQYMFLHPIDTVFSGVYGLLSATGFGFGGEGFDFLPVNPFTGVPGFLQPGNGLCAGSTTQSPGTGGCAPGTGATYFPGGPPRIPPFLQAPTMNRQDYGIYLDDTFSPTDRIKIDVGARVDGSTFLYPSEAPCNLYASTAATSTIDATTGANQCLFQYNAFNSSGQPIVSINSQARTPFVVEPRTSFSWQFTRNDAVRGSYGRSVEFPPIADIDSRTSRAQYLNQFGNIPASPFVGNICGVTSSNPCSSFGDQLYWDNQNAIDGVPIEQVKPETFNNYDFSYSHQFGGGVGVKVTPFYRRGYDALALVASVKTDKLGNPITTATGALLLNPAVSTNNGLEKTTGIEFLVTRDIAYGLSGQFAATYINELSNVIPLSGSEDFFPTIPPASLAVGNLYRVGFLSPFTAVAALQYKTRGGVRINPVISWNKGYPIGNGLISAVYLNTVAQNVVSTNTSTIAGSPTSPVGSSGSMQYVDPLNPGSLRTPNILATRGGALSASAGGLLTAARFNANLGIDFTPPGSKNTIGVFVSNLFGNVYGQPSVNSRWQPLATGIGGVKTGTSTSTTGFPGNAVVNYTNDRFGFDPFILSPTGTPTTFQLYYQLTL
jgi:hypothetical protein